MITLNHYAQNFSALSDEFRLKILVYLYAHGEQCVCDISDFFSLGQSNISYHLKLLSDAGIINKRKVAVWNYYSINQNHILYPFLHNILENVQKEELNSRV